MLDKYLATLTPMRAAKAKQTLLLQVRVNGDAFMTRAALIEGRVASGATIVAMTVPSMPSMVGQRVLMNRDGSFLDQANATKTGLDYAEFLIAQGPLGTP
jgi:hypothetical protein